MGTKYLHQYAPKSLILVGLVLFVLAANAVTRIACVGASITEGAFIPGNKVFFVSGTIL